MSSVTPLLNLYQKKGIATDNKHIITLYLSFK